MKQNENIRGMELNDKELDQVTGGFKIFVAKCPQFLKTILRVIFRIKDGD
ncbi:MAG: bacteriocin [Clostridia bacterium]|nr:bacteriocin [Clostridia bacterium]